MPATAPQSTFRFYADPFSKARAASAADTLVAPIPAGVNSKTQLLEMLSKELRFPLYFGWNWDALSDCLRDLHWLENIRQVRIVHEALPFLPGWKKRGLYLNVLSDAIHSWNANPGIQLEVWFPEQARSEVETALSPRLR